MIELSFADAFFTYLLLWILFIGILWCRELARVKNFDWKVSNSRLFHCDNCHHSFIVKDSVNLTRCPRCNSICIFRKQRNLE